MRIGMLADVYFPHISGITNHIVLAKRYLEVMKIMKMTIRMSSSHLVYLSPIRDSTLTFAIT